MFNKSRKLKVRKNKKTFLRYLWDKPDHLAKNGVIGPVVFRIVK